MSPLPPENPMFYRLIWKDLRTQAAGILSPGPLTRQEALTLIATHTPHGATVLMMQEIRQDL